MLKLQEDLNLENYSLILPSVAVGNVGQLSVDLLIKTLELKRIGRVFDTAFIPLVGANPYDQNSDDTCTAIDLYASEEKKIVVLQIRSPPVRRPIEFFHSILNLVTDYKISKVIILTSGFGHENKDQDIKTPPFRYLASKKALTECEKTFEDMSWIYLVPKQINEFSNETDYRIHGGGFAKILFDMLHQNNIFCVVLLKYCSEGDNIPDAIDLINYFNQWLKIILVDEKNSCKLVFPPSWKFLFGNSPPGGLY